MVKVCLLFVLFILFVFPTPAQSNIKYVNNFGIINKAETYADAAASTATQKIDGTNSTESSDLQDTLIAAMKKSFSVISSSRPSKDKSLGAFSTGDPLIDNYILEACLRHDVDPLLIYAQMFQESAFKKKATSYKGASGLMQLMPATARRFGVTNIYHPKQNIEAGVKYMRWLLDEFGGDVRLALAAYNAGEGAVKKFGNQIPPYRETQNYVNRITDHYSQIRF